MTNTAHKTEYDQQAEDFLQSTGTALTMNYNIILHDLGFTFGPPGIHELDITAFIADCGVKRLEYNLDNLWSWNKVLEDQDGPAVAIKFVSQLCSRVDV